MKVSLIVSAPQKFTDGSPIEPEMPLSYILFRAKAPDLSDAEAVDELRGGLVLCDPTADPNEHYFYFARAFIGDDQLTFGPISNVIRSPRIQVTVSYG